MGRLAPKVLVPLIQTLYRQASIRKSWQYRTPLGLNYTLALPSSCAQSPGTPTASAELCTHSRPKQQCVTPPQQPSCKLPVFIQKSPRTYSETQRSGGEMGIQPGLIWGLLTIGHTVSTRWQTMCTIQHAQYSKPCAQNGKPYAQYRKPYPLNEHLRETLCTHSWKCT